jgi:hypothetical protein
MKVVAFTVADKNNEKYLEMFKNSLRKWHTEEELPLTIVNQEWLDKIKDPQKFYKMTPMIAKDLIEKYDLVIKFDCDQLVTGKLNHLWEDVDYDIGTVLNGNPKEPPVSVWDINPAQYMNCGLVVMKSKHFINHWWNLCNSAHFQNYQFREQDLMNVMIYYMDYKVRCFDWSENWHGLVHKGWWQYMEVTWAQEKSQETPPQQILVLPKGDRPWPVDGDKTIKVIHWAGGNEPNKMNVNIRFQPEVAKWLNNLTK